MALSEADLMSYQIVGMDSALEDMTEIMARVKGRRVLDDATYAALVECVQIVRTGVTAVSQRVSQLEQAARYQGYLDGIVDSSFSPFADNNEADA